MKLIIDLPDDAKEWELPYIINEGVPIEECDDCVNRQVAIYAIKHAQVNFNVESEIDFTKHKREVQEIIDNILGAQEKALKELPPVKPTEKVGHWIPPQWDDGMSDPIYYQVRCSKCGFDLDPQTFGEELKKYGADRFCPKCGAKMQEVEE